MERFIKRYKELDIRIKRRFIIENDDKSYTLKDCIEIYKKTGVPVLFDIYHHKCKNNGETILAGLQKAYQTWEKEDGLPIIHYSSLKEGGNLGNHALYMNQSHFKTFLNTIKDFNIDIMLEIKDKEKSALKALKILHEIRSIDTSKL